MLSEHWNGTGSSLRGESLSERDDACAAYVPWTYGVAMLAMSMVPQARIESQMLFAAKGSTSTDYARRTGGGEA